MRAEDVSTWHREKSGLFTVSYCFGRISRRAEHREHKYICTRQPPDLGKTVVNTGSTKKIKIFTWRLANEGPATMQNRKQRNLEAKRTCHLYGQGEEDGFDAVIARNKSKGTQRGIEEKLGRGARRETPEIWYKMVFGPAG